VELEKGPLDIHRHLLRDERIVWSSSPVKKYFLKYLLSRDPWRPMGYFYFFFGLVFAAFPALVFSLDPAPSGGPPLLLFSLIGIFLAAMGYSLSLGRRRRALKLFAHTAYYLTNKRAIILSGKESAMMISIDLRRVPQVSLALVEGTIGNIVFGESDPAIRTGFFRFFDMWAWWGRGDRDRLPGFIAIEHADEIMRRIAEVEENMK
jgi:hypothetical protein